MLDAASVQRLTPETWAGAEAQLAAKAPEYTPSGLQAWGDALVALLDQDGAEPDDRPPAQVNELHLARHRSGGGGRLKGRFDDAAMVDAIAAVVDNGATPRTADDDRPTGRRQAEALADACGHVLDHGDDAGGAFTPGVGPWAGAATAATAGEVEQGIDARDRRAAAPRPSSRPGRRRSSDPPWDRQPCGRKVRRRHPASLDTVNP